MGSLVLKNKRKSKSKKKGIAEQLKLSMEVQYMYCNRKYAISATHKMKDY
jgi:hypothetical protein